MYLSLNHKNNLPYLDWYFGSWIFFGTQRDQVCKYIRSADKHAVSIFPAGTYELHQSIALDIQNMPWKSLPPTEHSAVSSVES